MKIAKLNAEQVSSDYCQAIEKAKSMKSKRTFLGELSIMRIDEESTEIIKVAVRFVENGNRSSLEKYSLAILQKTDYQLGSCDLESGFRKAIHDRITELKHSKASTKSFVDRTKDAFTNHVFFAPVMLLSVIVISMASFTDSIDKLMEFYKNRISKKEVVTKVSTVSNKESQKNSKIMGEESNILSSAVLDALLNRRANIRNLETSQHHPDSTAGMRATAEIRTEEIIQMVSGVRTIVDSSQHDEPPYDLYQIINKVNQEGQVIASGGLPPNPADRGTIHSLNVAYATIDVADRTLVLLVGKYTQPDIFAQWVKDYYSPDYRPKDMNKSE